MKYNNISFAELDETFAWNVGYNYWFEGSEVCKKSIPSNLTIFSDFIDNTGCCEEACGTSTLIDTFQCLTYQYNDGVCNSECNNAKCGWDGNDCSQLCECDVSGFGDGICNQACNTTNCLYDGYDCLSATFYLLSCELSYNDHGCNINWVGAGWCDYRCKSQFECGFDKKIVIIVKKQHNVVLFIEYFNLLLLVKLMMNI